MPKPATLANFLYAFRNKYTIYKKMQTGNGKSKAKGEMRADKRILAAAEIKSAPSETETETENEMKNKGRKQIAPPMRPDVIELATKSTFGEKELL